MSVVRRYLPIFLFLLIAATHFSVCAAEPKRDDAKNYLPIVRIGSKGQNTLIFFWSIDNGKSSSIYKKEIVPLFKHVDDGNLIIIMIQTSAGIDESRFFCNDKDTYDAFAITYLLTGVGPQAACSKSELIRIKNQTDVLKFMKDEVKRRYSVRSTPAFVINSEKVEPSANFVVKKLGL